MNNPLKNFLLVSLLNVALSALAVGQGKQPVKPGDYLGMRWSQVASQMPAEWYASREAWMVAENVLLTQREVGGWAKNKPYHHVFTEGEKAQFTKERQEIGATFDNGATITELKFLARVYASQKDERYKAAFEKGLAYVLTAQYGNGGWPQFFPLRQGSSVAYASHVTYNDDAMVNIMKFLRDIHGDKGDYRALQVPGATKEKAREAFDKGIGCILASQIRVNGRPTVWCAQHDRNTLVPANARKYELASFSGAESVGITQLLMGLQNPSSQVIAAVQGAVAWFEKNKVEGIRLEKKTIEGGKSDLTVVQDRSAPAIWARFYDLNTQKPFFCDRDGVMKFSLAEIGHERRNNYGWYTDTPHKILQAYPGWVKKWGVK
ncbi:pectate lyase (plasmid) [Rufibacter tibetensis]|uniref:Pectate lyase n=2 Tax=Rufibacter tibetensis TaxID=512763 RepID=A0A0N7HXD7_9BACT|nr:pectate lyase [Rufibacter tibetensis]